MKPDTEWAETSPGTFSRRYRGMDLRVIDNRSPATPLYSHAGRGVRIGAWTWQAWLNVEADYEPLLAWPVSGGMLEFLSAAQRDAERAVDAEPFAEVRP